MTISYNWLCTYLPEKIEPERLSRILTSVGLEVESMELHESVKGGLNGLVVGEVVECSKHPDADKLSLTKVNTGNGELLQIVCGAPNVATGQKVVVATIGTTIYPSAGEPLTMKKAKIRGQESQGMICAEDEIGIGNSHDGIIILPAATKVGTPAREVFNITDDFIFEIGLTPNRMEAMSHLGVAKDVCAYLTHHNNKHTSVKSPFKNTFKIDDQGLQIEVKIENPDACQRYAGVSIQGVTVGESPDWLKLRIAGIGLRSINNIVDITNFILHETGQPLHAFDAGKITGKKVLVKNLPEGTSFISLDEKERKLSAEDLMICDGENNPMCIGGVFGGLTSGVTHDTKDIFLESAWFNPVSIRKSSLRHGLRTDAATRFEKGVDISNCVQVLKRAAMMIVETAGGKIASNVVDIYPDPKPRKEIALKYHYMKKLSGKNYHPDTVKNILGALGIEFIKEGADEMWFSIPHSKPDITLQADLVEEIMRIDGLDNVDIPQQITITPSVETNDFEAAHKERMAAYLAGSGFNEIFTNSITNSKYFDEDTLSTSVKMINNLSAELDIMRPSMLQTGLESIAYNLNRKNNQIRFFEFGKTYSVEQTGKYTEVNHLCLYISGASTTDGWKIKAGKPDFFELKGAAERIIALAGITGCTFSVTADPLFENTVDIKVKNELIGRIGQVSKNTLQQFDIKQPVFYGDFYWDILLGEAKKVKTIFSEIPRYPAVERDLSIVVDKSLTYDAVEKTAKNIKLNKLKKIQLFDVFESDKLGAGKKAMAINFTFLDEEKTLTDKEIETMMDKLAGSFEKELQAEIRK